MENSHKNSDCCNQCPNGCCCQVGQDNDTTPLKSFGPKPLIAWDCVRTRKSKVFQGIEEVQMNGISHVVPAIRLEFQRALFLGTYATRSTRHSIIRRYIRRYRTDPESLQTGDRTADVDSNERHTATLEPVIGTLSVIIGGLWVGTGSLLKWFQRFHSYSMKTKKFDEVIPPPPGMHLVLGIFDDSGILLDEVILYTGGPSITKQLVKARRGLFSLPILRDIKAFELYKCDSRHRTHTRVKITQEAQDSMAALFRCVERWERYHSLKKFVDRGWDISGFLPIDFVYGLYWVVSIIAFMVVGRLKLNLEIVDRPSQEEEIAWKTWIHENLNEGKIDPKEGQFSILCVIGWSRSNIIMFVVVPFVSIAIASVVFGIIWSQDFHHHQGDISGAWTVASFIITLTAAAAAILGIVGGFAYN